MCSLPLFGQTDIPAQPQTNSNVHLQHSKGIKLHMAWLKLSLHTLSEEEKRKPKAVTGAVPYQKVHIGTKCEHFSVQMVHSTCLKGSIIIDNR